MDNSIYHIGFGVDTKYAKYAGVLMTNIVLTHLGQSIYFHIACDGMNEIDRKRFDNFALLYRNVKVFIYNCSKTLDNLNPISSKAAPRLHRAGLLRLLLPAIVPKEVKKLLYMDVDMLCLQRMDELWQLDMKNYPVGAVPYPPSISKNKKILYSGLLLFNVPQWNREDLTRKTILSYQKGSESMRGIEEDALNDVLRGNFLEIDEKFSFLIEAGNPLKINVGNSVVAMHFIFELKPWTKGCVPQIYEIYWKFVKQSLWNDMEPVEPSTVKAAFLAGTTAELQKDFESACKYYGAVARRLTEYYVEENKEWLFGEDI